MTDELLKRLEALVAEERAAKTRRRTARQADLERRVTAFLADHPDASGNAVWSSLGGRRADVLAAVRVVRQAATRYPEAGYQQIAGGAA